MDIETAKRLDAKDRLHALPIGLVRAQLAVVCQERITMDMNQVDRLVEANFRLGLGRASLTTAETHQAETIK